MLKKGRPLNLEGLPSKEKDELICALWEQIQQAQEELTHLRADYQKGLDANALLHQALAKAHEHIKALEGQLSKNSQNSSKPPSSDGLKKPNPKSTRPRGERSPGGQKGHVGTTLLSVEHPDFVEIHQASVCEHCQHSLEAVALLGVEKRQEFNISIPKQEVTEHQAEIKVCPHCGLTTKGKFPESITQPVQYGPPVKALAAYCGTYQLMPFKRTKEFFQDIYKMSISEGTLANFSKELHSKLEGYETTVKELITGSHCAHFDESGVRVNKILHWLHVSSTSLLTYYALHRKRGLEAMEDIGILKAFKGRAIHDHFKPYFDYQNCGHALCNAHHFREFIYHAEQYGQTWCTKLKTCLREAMKEVEAHRATGQISLDPKRLRYYEQKYSRILREGVKEIPSLPSSTKKRGRPKQHPTKNFYDRLKNFKRETLAFLHDFLIPPDNNQGERDIRMIKAKLKISGCFRSKEGGDWFCRSRGYISTARKNSVNVLEALNCSFQGTPFIPSLASTGTCCI